MREEPHPRPQFRRERWVSLNGSWAYSFSAATQPNEVDWQGEIVVPFPPESIRSGVRAEGFHPILWYRRSFEVPADWTGDRVVLHFGAIDYAAEVWLNGQFVARHEGGHTPFRIDVTDVLTERVHTLHVRAEDDPHDSRKPRGKQDWRPAPHGIWYPRTTGIWQSVWIEPVARTSIDSVRYTPIAQHFEIEIDVELSGPLAAETELRLDFSCDGRRLATDTWSAATTTARTIRLEQRLFDEVDEIVWSPEHPNLIDVELTLQRPGEELDRVHSYTALRSVEARNGRVYLNGRPYFLRLVLDQGYWDDSLLAAPDDDALRRDVELAKAMGFNGVRKHQKVENPRFLYWADKLGLLVWAEMPSAYQFTPLTVDRITREWLEVVDRDYNHPCIVAWVCFNESWGVPDLPHDPRQRHFIASMYHLTKSIDRTRPVVGNDGWEHVVSDLLTIHDYSPAPDTLRERYGRAEATEDVLSATLEHGRAVLLEGVERRGQPVILSEFGGIRFHPGDGGWGYQQVDDSDALLELYSTMIAALTSHGLAGFCYTQFADTFQEQNGLLYSDRRPKVPLAALSSATRGGG